MTHRRSARLLAAAPRAGRAALGLCLAAGLAGPGVAQSRRQIDASVHASALRVPVTTAPGETADGRPLPAGAVAPDPRLGAEDVVGIVLAALAEVPRGAEASPSDVGIAQAFAFASPANRAAVGSVERFADLVQDDAYRPLLGHRQATRGALRVSGDRATQRVVVTGAEGDRVAYTFTLARQMGGSFRGCWMTESVVREAPSRIAVAFAA